jgi:hypothetical protein
LINPFSESDHNHEVVLSVEGLVSDTRWPGPLHHAVKTFGYGSDHHDTGRAAHSN